MKKLLILTLMIGTVAVFVPAVEAKSSNTAVITEAQQLWEGPQRRGRQNDRRWNNNRRTRTYTTTRVVRRGRALYRETIRVTRYSNGRTRTQVIRRVRIR
jgi:hypothetical protein